jgi:hypothetical protein
MPTKRTTMNDAKNLHTEREHSRYENALMNIAHLAQDGIEQFSAEEKNKMLNEIQEEAEEAL